VPGLTITGGVRESLVGQKKCGSKPESDCQQQYRSKHCTIESVSGQSRGRLHLKS
jgi:hypothetical protein